MKEASRCSYKELTGTLKEIVIIPKKQGKAKEEEYECLDRGHFITEYRNLSKKAEDVEFNLKSLMNLKRNSSQLDQNFQLILHVKYEIELKLRFLGKDSKIDTKQLVEDIHHFTELLKNISCNPGKSEKYVSYYDEVADDNYGEYDDDYPQYYAADGDEDDCYPVNVKMAKKNRKKNAKAKKKGSTTTSTTDTTEPNTAVMLH
jgi:hypothetical protein